MSKITNTERVKLATILHTKTCGKLFIIQRLNFLSISCKAEKAKQIDKCSTLRRLPEEVFLQYKITSDNQLS